MSMQFKIADKGFGCLHFLINRDLKIINFNIPTTQTYFLRTYISLKIFR